MAIETTPVAGIQDLNASYPLSGDPRHQGDDHFNLTKDALIKTFAGIISDAAVQGPVLTNTEELNLLQGLTADASELNLLAGRSLASTDDVIDNFPAGTIMLFSQTAAPTGWTKDTTNYNNSAIRVVTGTASGSTAGNSFTTNFANRTVSSVALTTSQIPAHTHGAGSYSAVSNGAHTHTTNVSNSSSSGSMAQALLNANASGEITTDSDGAHVHSITGTSGSTGSGATHNHTLDMTVDYVDVIRATKQ